jgi:tape measure domain-containing protein
MSALTVTIGADITALKSAFSNATKHVADFGGKIKSLGSTGAFVGAAVPIAAMGAALAGTLSIMREYAAYDGLVRSLKALDGTAQATTQRLNLLRNVAKMPGLGFEEVVRGDVRLRSAGISAKTSEAAMRAFGNALAMVGGGKAELDGVFLALTQIASGSRVGADEIRQLAERVPQVRVAMKAAFGTADTEQLAKLGITSEKFIEGLIKQLAKLPKVTDSALTAVENFDDSWKAFKNNTAEVFLPAASTVLSLASDLMKGASYALRDFKEVMGMKTPGLEGKDGQTEKQRIAAIEEEKKIKAETDAAKQKEDVWESNYQFWADLEQQRIQRQREDADKQVAIEEERAKQFREIQERGYASQLSEIDNLKRQIENLKNAGEWGSDAVAKATDSGYRNQLAERTVQIQELQKRLAEALNSETEKSKREAEQQAKKDERDKIRLDPITTSLSRVGGGGYGSPMLDIMRESARLQRESNGHLKDIKNKIKDAPTTGATFQ